MITFGQRAQAARKVKGLTLEKVAKAVRSHKGYVSGIENGKVNAPSMKILRKMCQVLGMDEFKSMLVVTIEKCKDEDVRAYLEEICSNELGEEHPQPARKSALAAVV